MNLVFIWEQLQISVQLPAYFTPLELLEQLTAKGRKLLYSVIICNYREEFQKEFDQITNFEKKNFK